MDGRLLRESEGYGLLEENGIPVPSYRMAGSVDEAVRAAREIGYPVVLKIVSPDIVHKSDVGGVALGIADETMLKDTFRAIMERVSGQFPDARIDGIIVEKEMPDGLELIIGGKIDPAFGKIVTFGIGGTLVELLRDVAIRVIPLSEAEVRDMIRSIHAYPLIRGYRGSRHLDEEALIMALRKVCDMFWSNDTIAEFDLNPLILYESGVCAVDARFIVQEQKGPDSGGIIPVRTPVDTEIFHPKTIALVGASSNPNKLGYAIFRNILAFDGTEYPVNPNAEELFGRKVYRSVLDIPEPVDTVLIAVPAPVVLSVLDEAGRKGARLAIIISVGFRETGELGARLEEDVVAIGNKYGIRIMGPNCLGMMLPHRNLNATFDPTSPRPGHIAFISQSGAVITTIIDWSLIEEIGMSAVISVGNQADLTFEDYLEFAVSDPGTKAIILYIEEIKNGREFLNYARKISGKKPIVAIKSGSSQKGRKAASSHTGSLAGSYEVYRAAFRQAGVISVHALREAFDVAGLLASEGYPKGPRAVIVTSAGGFAVLSSDYAEENGIGLIELSDDMLQEFSSFLPDAWSKENPIDMVGDAGVDRYARIFNVLIRHQDEWDIAFVIAVPSVTLDPTHIANEIVRFSRHTHKMVVGCLLGGESTRSGIRLLRNAHIPNFSELEDAFRAVGLALERKKWIVEEHLS